MFKRSFITGLLSLLVIVILIGCTEETHDVKFVVGNAVEDIIIEVKDGEVIEAIDAPSYKDYQFLAWYTSDDYVELFDFDQAITQDTTIYARFSDFELGKENYIVFKDNGFYGFMKPTGEIVIEAKYDRVEPFRYGYALVIKDSTVGFIDVLGNEISTSYNDYPNASLGYIQFSEDNITKLYIGNGVTKFIDNQGDALFEIENTETLRVPLDAYFNNGLLPIIEEEKCVYYNSQGEVALDGNYLDCSNFDKGIAGVLVESGSIDLGTYQTHYVFINTTGEIVIETDLSEIYTMFDGIKPVIYKDGFAIGRVLPQLSSDETAESKYIVINEQGETVVEFDQDEPVDVWNGYVLTKNNQGYYSVFDIEGNQILDYIYKASHYQRNATMISEDGLVVLANEDNLYGAVEVETGDIIIDFEYDFLMSFIDGFAVAKKDGLYGVIDIDNNVIVEFIYEDMFSVARTFID